MSGAVHDPTAHEPLTEWVERARSEHGRRRFSLFTGDVGSALFARSCLDADLRFPIMDVW